MGLPGLPGVAGPVGAPAALPSVQSILFDYDKSDIRASEQPKIAAVAKFLDQNRGARVGLSGHADPRGGDRYNLALSERRMTAVRDALVAAGVDNGRIVTAAVGKQRPKCTEATEECWARDRRVEVFLQASE